MCKSTKEKYACKSISKKKLHTRDDVEDVRREVAIMHHLNGHPNIVVLKGAYEDKEDVHLVQEVCEGGELFDRIVAMGHYSEKGAAEVIRTILQVVKHCHDLGVIHRDLKPENFLMLTSKDSSPIKATDFGLSIFARRNDVFKDVVGSAFYVAPDVLHRNYSYPADVWSVGVILYILLCGVPPFWADTEQGIFKEVLRGNVDFSGAPWPGISQEAVQCVKMLLTKDPAKRPTAAEMLQNKWVRGDGVSDVALDNAVLTRLRKFSNMNRMKKMALKVIATSLAPTEIEGLQAVFKSLDADNSGTLTYNELMQGLTQSNSTTTKDSIRGLLNQLDMDGNGQLDYEEFIAASVSLSRLESDENLMKAFKFFDSDASGYITKDELVQGLKDMKAEMADIEEILMSVDKDGDGRIDYEEFAAMMRAGNTMQSRIQSSTSRSKSR